MIHFSNKFQRIFVPNKIRMMLALTIRMEKTRSVIIITKFGTEIWRRGAGVRGSYSNSIGLLSSGNEVS